MPDIAELPKRIRAMADTLSQPSPLERRLTKVGVQLKRVGASEVHLGSDRGFSGWRRGAPIQLGLAFKVHTDSSGLTMHRTARSAGPWKVAEDGRNRGGSSGVAGPGVNRTTGVTARTKSGRVRKVRATRGRRWNGYTAGRGTWTAAQSTMSRAAGSALADGTAADLKAAHEGR